MIILWMLVMLPPTRFYQRLSSGAGVVVMNVTPVGVAIIIVSSTTGTKTHSWMHGVWLL
jgi:hypothetical protein